MIIMIDYDDDDDLDEMKMIAVMKESMQTKMIQ